MNRKGVILSVMAVVVAGVLVLLFQSWSSYQTLSVSFADNVRVEAEIYRLNDGDEGESDPVETIDTDTDLRLKKGSYFIRTEANKDHVSQTLEVNLGDEPEQVTIDPAYSVGRLGAMLTQEIDAIHASIRQAVELGDNYKLNTGALYKKGEWYGTTIVPNLSDEELRTSYVDAFRVVARKEGSGWQLITTPELVVTSPEYPDIPREVLVEVNKQFGAENEG